MSDMTIGQRIRERRKELGLSQEELALRLGNKSRASVCTVEKGKEDLTTARVRQYADALDCTPAYLMGWEDEKGDATPYAQLVNAYVVNQKRDELFSIYEGLSPEKQATFEAYLKFLQAQP